MRNKDIFLMGFKNLWRRKARTSLAISGVVIGTCAIVVMLSLGIGLSEGFKSQVESFGNLHLVDVRKGYSKGPSSSQKKQVKLNDATVSKIEKIPGVTAVSPILEEYMKVAIGRKVASFSLIGIKPEVMQKFNYNLSEGRLLKPDDKYAIVFGNSIPSWFYNPKNNNDTSETNVISNKLILTANMSYGEKHSNSDDKVKYPEYKAQGVGLLENPNDESSYQAYINIKTLIEIKDELAKAKRAAGVNDDSFKSGKNLEYSSIKIYVEDIDKVKEISKMLKDEGFSTYSLNDILDTMNQTANMIQAVLGGIGAISLFVAALGITNTMIMSIYERTREIGVMKVIGSNLKDIRNLFLFEAASIGLIGGSIGLVLSYLISIIMNTFLSGMLGSLIGSVGDAAKVSIIPIWLALVALIFSTSIGILAGYFPARRAMNLSALESLRNE